jgi:hypothetical protein
VHDAVGEAWAELLKTRKRWLPYVLFIIAVLGVLLIMFPAGYLGWRQADDSDPAFASTALRTFVFPYSLTALVDSGQYWGAMLTGVLAGSVVATEYRWGTVRQVLVRGQPRTRYLGIKVLVIAGMATAGLLTALAIGLLISLLTTDAAGEPITLDVPGDPSAGDFLLMLGRSAWSIIPYGMLAVMLAVVSRSSMVSVTGIIVFLFGEALAIELMGSLGDVGEFLQDISLGENVKILMAENRFFPGDYNAISLRERPAPGEAGDAALAFLVIGAHTALYTGVAFAVFGRRDVVA